MTRTTRAAAEPPAWRRPLIIAIVALAAVVAGSAVALGLGGDRETASATPTPSPMPTITQSPEPSETPTPPETPDASPMPDPSETPAPSEAPTEDPGPTPVVAAPEDMLLDGTVVRVSVASLRMRSEPTTSADQVASFSRGALLVVGFSFGPGFGPIEADGFTWYPARSLGRTELPALGEGQLIADLGGPGGWVAVGEDGVSFVEIEAPRCADGDPDLATLAAQTPWEQLACVGDRTITFEGVFGCGGCGGFLPGTFEPAWLATPSYDLISVEPQEQIGPMTLRFPPGVERPEVASVLRVTGHFDDPASADCDIAIGDPAVAVDDRSAEMYCRTKFVVESFEVIGTDEDFPFG